VSRTVPACPHCTQPEEEPLVCDRCAWRWYSNPRPASGVLVERILRDGQPAILLLQRAVEPGLGGWDLPAGYLDPGESFEVAAVRETREESGLEVQLTGLSGVYHSPAANAVTAVFRATASDPDGVRLDFESSDYRWVGRADVATWLPRVAFPSMAQAIADWSRRDPDS
jgi:ADP-ribose pyrophosphatase YjhB (NUDIX family)